MADLIPQIGNFLWIIASFVVALSIIVAVHEFGHYIVGRWSGIHAETFSLGFGPVVFSRVDKRGTTWQIAALPFGGFVKFLGDSDAASGKDADAMQDMAEKDPEKLRRTMHGAPLWARSATVAAGPIFNFIMSILVYAALAMYVGKVAEPVTIGTLNALPEGSYDLREGDEIVSIAGAVVPEVSDSEAWIAFEDQIPLAPTLEYVVRRDGQQEAITGPYLSPPYVGFVGPRSAAYAADLRPGDVIVSVDGAPIFAFEQLKEAVEGSDGKVLLLQVWRDGQINDFALKPKRTDEPQPDGGVITHWRIGIGGDRAFEFGRTSVGVPSAIAGGVERTFGVISTSLQGIKHMFLGDMSTCNLNGPIGIAQATGAMASQGLLTFISLIALLSTAVGFLNLFPIPVLDGGHLVFYAYEAVAGRPPSDKALRVMMAAGLAVILSLMIFAVGNDLFCP